MCTGMRKLLIDIDKIIVYLKDIIKCSEFIYNAAIFNIICVKNVFAAEMQSKNKISKKVPKGTSDYQSSWIVDSDEEVSHWIFTKRSDYYI